MSRLAAPALSFTLATLAIVACGGPPAAPPPPPAPEPPPVASAAQPAAASSAEPAASAPKDEPPPPKKELPPPFGGEDPGKTVALTGPKAWTIVERGVGVYDLVEVKGTKATFKGFAGEGTFTVPSAFTRALAKPAKLKKGDPVLYTVVTTGTCGRVLEVKGELVTIQYPWGGQISKREVEPQDLIVVDGKVGYGVPITVQGKDDPAKLDLGTLVFDDGKNAWITDGSGESRKVPNGQIKPLDLAPLKVGATVMARGEVGKVVKVLDDALQYEVSLPGATKPTKFELCELTRTAAAPPAKKK